MPYCIHCGKENPEDARFCSGCGKPISSSTPSGERKQIYDGVIHKCPNCGEILNSFITTCPSCGYEIRGAQSSKTVKEFADKLDTLTATKQETARQRFWREEFTSAHHKNDEQKIELIKNFVIPTTKEDVLEFMSYAIGNINTTVLADDNYQARTERALSEAWIAKLDQAYSKAVVLFGNDPAFEPVKQLYLAKKEEIRRADKTKERKSKAPLMWGAIMFIALIIGMIALMKYGGH